MNTRDLLIGRITRSYVISGLTLYFIIIFYWLDSVNYYNILNIITLLTYAYLLWTCINKEESYFTNTRLWLTVFAYTFVFTIFYLQMCLFYTGNNFLFSEFDARVYERHAFLMKDMDFGDALIYISDIWRYDDWGAPVSMAYLLKIAPHKLFVNFCYVVMNSLSALFLFSIGRTLKMTRKYAYMSALSYAIASYTIFFLGSFLKEEILIFLVITSFYLLYQYHQKHHLIFLLLGAMVSSLTIFFRVPIALFIWTSYASLLLFGSKGHVKRMLFVFLIVAVSFFAAGLFFYSSVRYANRGDVSGSYQYVSTNLFQKAVSTVGALIGPFPALFQITSVQFTQKPMFGAGLLYKFLLFFPFWKGFLYAVKEKVIDVFPLYIFIVMEMIGLCLVVDGLEVRKAVPHFPLFILTAFWYLDRFDSDTNEEIRATPYYYWTYKGLTVSVVVVFILTLTWNMLLRIPGVQHIIMFSTDQ